MIEELMEKMKDMEYGFKDDNGENIIITNPKRWDENFNDFYYLQTPEELLETKCGVCWDFVEFERRFFEEKHIPHKTYFVMISEEDMLPSHTFLTFEQDEKYYWFEYSWDTYKGLHKYEEEKELLKDVVEKFRASHEEVKEDSPLYLYEYQKPKDHITCDEFYKYVETQKEVKIEDSYYRVTYDGKGIYNELKKKVQKEEWENLLRKKEFTWLPKPPIYESNNKSYFTEIGYKKFEKEVLPILKEYFEEEKIKIVEYKNIEDAIYRDEFQVIIKES